MADIVHEALVNAATLGGNLNGKWAIKFVDGTSVTGTITRLPTGSYYIHDNNNGVRYAFHPSMVVHIYAA